MRRWWPGCASGSDAGRARSAVATRPAPCCRVCGLSARGRTRRIRSDAIEGGKWPSRGRHRPLCVSGLPAAHGPLASVMKEFAMSHVQNNLCIEACDACAAACNHCAASCLQEADVRMMARCIALDMDCAAACQFAAAAMARGSEHMQAICTLCAELCDACGAECGRHAMDHCQHCAAACRRCAEECRRMAGAGQAAPSIAPMN